MQPNRAAKDPADTGKPTERASDRAYNELLRLTLDLTLAPGELVREQALADRLELGRMPVREGIARLVGDGLIEVIPRRGAFICPITMQKVLEIFEARDAIECGVARLAAVKASTEQVAVLRGLVHHVESDRGTRDNKNFVADDLEVHRYLLKIVGNTLLHDAMDRLLLHNVRFWNWYFWIRPATPGVMASHQDLLSAVEDRSPDRAYRAMQGHIEKSRELVGALFGSADVLVESGHVQRRT